MLNRGVFSRLCKISQQLMILSIFSVHFWISEIVRFVITNVKSVENILVFTITRKVHKLHIY